MIQATVGVIHDFSEGSCALNLFARVINAIIIVFPGKSADERGINETEVKQTISATTMSHKMRQCKKYWPYRSFIIIKVIMCANTFTHNCK